MRSVPPGIPPIPTLGKSLKQEGKLKKVGLPPCPPGFNRKNDNAARVEALVALSDLMVKLPEIQNDQTELIKYINHVCVRRGCNLITSPMIKYLGFGNLGLRLEDFPASALVLILGFLYEGTCVEEPLHKGCQTFESQPSPMIHVINKFNPSTPKKMGCGEIPNYLHTVSFGFKSHEAMLTMAQEIHTPELIELFAIKALGFRENPKKFRTEGEYEMKVWLGAARWKEQAGWLEMLVNTM